MALKSDFGTRRCLTKTVERSRNRGSQEPHAESNARTGQSSKPYLNRGGRFLPQSTRSDRIIIRHRRRSLASGHRSDGVRGFVGRVRRAVRAALPRRPHRRTPGPRSFLISHPLFSRFVPCVRSNLTCCSCLQTRYVMKYRHCEGKLVLKVTDDREVPCLSLFAQICDWLS